MGCFVSTQNDFCRIRRMPGNIGEVVVFVPGLRIPKPIDFSQSLGNHLSNKLVERLSALRTNIIVMAHQLTKKLPLLQDQRERVQLSMEVQHCVIFNKLLKITCLYFGTHACVAGGSTLCDLQQTLEDYLPVLLGLVKDGNQFQHKAAFAWLNQGDSAEGTVMSSALYEMLSVLHLMTMLLFSQANLLLPGTPGDAICPKYQKAFYNVTEPDQPFLFQLSAPLKQISPCNFRNLMRAYGFS